MKKKKSLNINVGKTSKEITYLTWVYPNPHLTPRWDTQKWTTVALIKTGGHIVERWGLMFRWEKRNKNIWFYIYIYIYKWIGPERDLLFKVIYFTPLNQLTFRNKSLCGSIHFKIFTFFLSSDQEKKIFKNYIYIYIYIYIYMNFFFVLIFYSQEFYSVREERFSLASVDKTLFAFLAITQTFPCCFKYANCIPGWGFGPLLRPLNKNILIGWLGFMAYQLF